MPQHLARETAKLIARCQSDEEVRTTARQALKTAAEYGFNHGNAEFVQAMCDELTALADSEPDATRKQRLVSAVETVCALANELGKGRQAD